MDEVLAALAPKLSLIATDLDGTLLQSDGSISARNRAAVLSAQEAGLTVAFITARPPRIVCDLAADLGLGGIAVCSNGAILFDMTAREMMHHAPLGSPVARDLIAAIRQLAPTAVFAVEYGHMLGYEPDFPLIFEDAMRLYPTSVDHAERLCDQVVTKLIVHHPERDADDLAEMIAPLLMVGGDVTHSGGPFVEIAAQGVSKATGLRTLCGRLGLTADEVVAFGDMPNDLPMLGFAALGVAVGNAHRSLLAAADLIAPSNDDDGVAVVIERILHHR